MITLIFLISSIYAQFSIKYPEKYAKKNIKFSIANYGYVPYGQIYNGVLEMTNSEDLCNIIGQKAPQYQGENHYESSNKMVIAKRGGCTFFEKSIKAEQLGYGLLIIVDNQDEDIENVIMISRDSTNDVRLPTIMISKKDGEEIIKNIDSARHESKTLKASILFPEIPKTDIVSYSYWFSAMDSKSYQFLEQFYPFHIQMSKSLNFQPHYALDTNQEARNQGYQMRNAQCRSGGRYCVQDPDGSGPLQGSDVIDQIIMQLCIFDKNQSLWWKYVLSYQDQCLKKNTIDMNACEQKVMKKVGLNYDEIYQCFKDSFDYDPIIDELDIDIQDNKLLKKEYEYHSKYNLFKWPILMINEQIYQGSLIQHTNISTNAQQLFDTSHYGPLQAICKGFNEKGIPKVCQENMSGNGEIIQSTSGSSTWFIWFLAIILMAFVMFATMFFFKRKSRKDFNEKIAEEVNIHLSQYHAFIEQGKK